MIGSITEVQQQLAEQERRRQQFAAQQAPAHVTNSESVTAAQLAAGRPAAGCAAAPTALKAAEPDIGKRKKGHGERKDRDLRTGPLTDAHEAAGAPSAVDAAAAKSHADRGIHLGPDHGVMPGHPAPENFDRGYVDQGHASPSPMADGPRANPMPQMQHRVLPDAPYAAAIPQHVIASYTMGSPSDR